MEEDNRHLPRRPAKNKPLLKYCQTPVPNGQPPAAATQPPSIHTQRAAPVTLFSPNDVYLYKQQGAQSLLPPSSIPSSLYMASLMSPSGSSLNPFGNYLFVGGPGSPGGQGLTAGQLLGSPVVTRDTKVTSSSRMSSNPYARPISANDVVADPNMIVKSTALVSSIRTNSTNSISNSNSKPEDKSLATIQTNSFMRPRSAIMADMPQEPKPPPSPARGGKGASNSEHSVIHVHMDHHRPAEKGIPKPPVGSKPQGTSNRPPSGRKSSLTIPISTSSLSGSALTSSTRVAPSSPSVQAEGTPTTVPSSPTMTKANRITASPVASRRMPGSPKHIEGSPNAKLSNQGNSSSPKLTVTHRASSSPNLSFPKATGPSSRLAATPISNAFKEIENTAKVNSPKPDKRDLTASNKDMRYVINNNNALAARHQKLISGISTDITKNSITLQNQALVVTKSPIESLLESDNSRSSSAGSNNSVSGVRNPHYTPNKPYSEVTQPRHMGDLAPTVVSNISANVEKNEKDDSKLDSLKDILTSKPPTPPSSKFRTSPEQLKDGLVKKMPVTGTLTGTVYYRKQSKAEEPIRTMKNRLVHRGLNHVCSSLSLLVKSKWNEIMYFLILPIKEVMYFPPSVNRIAQRLTNDLAWNLVGDGRRMNLYSFESS